MPDYEIGKLEELKTILSFYSLKNARERLTILAVRIYNSNESDKELKRQ